MKRIFIQFQTRTYSYRQQTARQLRTQYAEGTYLEI